MLFNENKINKSSISYEIAKKLAKGRDIYSPAVLSENRFNTVFIHHVLALEHDFVLETLKKVFSAVNSTNYGTVHVFGTNNTALFKIKADFDVSKTLEALGMEFHEISNYTLGNGKKTITYGVFVELTF